MFSRIWYWFIQSLLWPVSWVLMRLFYKIETRGKENFSAASKPVIIVANHRSFPDPFLIGISLPWLSGFFPLRFMTEEIEFIDPVLQFLMDIKILKLVYLIFGGFPSQRGIGVEAAVELPAKLLASGQNIVLFPEGKMNLEKGLGIFYPGASALAIKSQADILPIGLVFSGKKIRISIGKPFKIRPTDSIDVGTSLIRQRVEELLK